MAWTPQTAEALLNAVIIGAGIIGISTAAFLQRAGWQVTVVDRVPPGEGCSYGNAGGIAFAEIVPTVHPRMLLKIPGWLLDPLGPLTIRWRHLPRALPWFMAAARNALPARVKANTEARALLGLRAVRDFETLLGAAGALDLMSKRDALRLYDTEAEFAAEAEEREIKQRHGYDAKRLSPGDIADLEPSVAPDFACGAFHGGWFHVSNPERVVKSIAAHVAGNGGTILMDDVKAFEREGRRVTALQLASGKTLPVDHLAVCAGAYSGLIAGELGDSVLLEAERGYHLVLPDPGIALTRTITYAKTPMAITPMEMGLRLAGTDEFAGLDAPPDWRRADVLWKTAKRVFPALNPIDERATRWMGRRPGTPDSLPVIGRSKTMENVFYNFGHSHMGLTWGPSSGRMLSGLMTGQGGNVELSAFRVDRF